MLRRYADRGFSGDGPKDIIVSPEGRIRAIDADLRRAALDAYRAACRAQAERFDWRACAADFLAKRMPIGQGRVRGRRARCSRF